MVNNDKIIQVMILSLIFYTKRKKNERFFIKLYSLYNKVWNEFCLFFYKIISSEKK